MQRRTYVYILRCGDGSFYTGQTFDIANRIVQHNSGKGAKYTNSRLPVKLIYLEPCVSRSAALKRERQIKQMRRGQKETLVLQGKKVPKRFASL